MRSKSWVRAPNLICVLRRKLSVALPAALPQFQASPTHKSTSNATLTLISGIHRVPVNGFDQDVKRIESDNPLPRRVVSTAPYSGLPGGYTDLQIRVEVGVAVAGMTHRCVPVP